MSETFKVGDVVKLKSGSQRMVISRITEDASASPGIASCERAGEFVCLWRHDGKDCYGTYAPALLEKVDESAPLGPINYD